MIALDVRLVFVLLGPAFVMAGLWRWRRAHGLAPQARTWLILGAAFSAVAAWLLSAGWRGSA